MSTDNDDIETGFDEDESDIVDDDSVNSDNENSVLNNKNRRKRTKLV
jgi:hypothetical protein